MLPGSKRNLQTNPFAAMLSSLGGIFFNLLMDQELGNSPKLYCFNDLSDESQNSSSQPRGGIQQVNSTHGKPSIGSVFMVPWGVTPLLLDGHQAFLPVSFSWKTEQQKERGYPEATLCISLVIVVPS